MLASETAGSVGRASQDPYNPHHTRGMRRTVDSKQFTKEKFVEKTEDSQEKEQTPEVKQREQKGLSKLPSVKVPEEITKEKSNAPGMLVGLGGAMMAKVASNAPANIQVNAKG